ncbi:MAG: hypothetical protein IPM56_07590 [Ignavibacteriales bacterium]|nr:MAG: hypothetical protein IPM56_07590 [Ignavibacteriales bacterium]
MSSDLQNKFLEQFSKHTREELQKTINREKLRNEVENDLLTNPKYRELHETYNALSIKNFISSYKYSRAYWLEFSDHFAYAEERKILKYSELAYEKLWEIQQKKLFDMQCLWRAESIQIPGVESTHDFMYWEKAITRCSFVPAINENEFDLYREYLLSDSYQDDVSLSDDWQDYDIFKKQYLDSQEGISKPEWYFYYDSRMGTGSLLSLPDVRGDKEDFYRNLFFENDKIENPEKYVIREPEDKRPPFKYYEKEILEEFINQYETAKVKESYRLAKEMKHLEVDLDDDILNALEILSETKDVSFVSVPNWRDSIILTAKEVEKENTYNALSGAYKNYLKRLESGIPFPESSGNSIEFTVQLIKIFKDQIIKGRILNGEPGDFDF